MLAGAYSTTLKSVGSKLESVRQWVDQSHYLPLYASGDRPVFGHVGNVAEAVNYFDGDGGSINVDRFPGLRRYLEVSGVPTHSVSIPRCDLVYFREAFHDAIELGHQYSVSVVGGNTLPGPSNAPPQTMVQPFGYHALVHARCEIGRPTCGRVLLVPCGVHHGRSGDRLLAELYTCSEASGHFVSSGVRRVESGLSFPTRGAPRRYTLALETARAERRGVFQYGLEMGAEELMPWVLKDRLADRGSSHSVRCGAVACKIENSTQFLNETHMLISSSLIRGAGSGLLLRPTPPGRQEVTIPQGAYLCFFANRTPAPERPPSDYELGSTRRGGAGVGVYDPQVYDGQNIGRFINQGGLLEGIKALVASCDLEQGGNLYQPAVAENTFDKYTNVVYTAMRGGQDTIVTARKAIQISNNQAIELLANYGLSYWFAFAVNNHVSLGHDSVLVKGIFWLLFSKYSSMPTSERAKYIPPDTPNLIRIKDDYVNCHCPFPIATERSRRGTI